MSTLRPGSNRYIGNDGEIVDSVSLLSSRLCNWAGASLEVYRVIEDVSHSDLSYNQPTIILPLIHTGQVQHRRNGICRKDVFRPSEMGVFTSDFLHQCHPTVGHEYCEIQLDPLMLASKATEFDLPVNQWGVEVSPSMAKPDMQLEYLSRALIAELQEGGNSGRLYTDQLISLIAFRILKQYSNIRAPLQNISMRGTGHKIRRALQLIHDCSARDLPLEEIAAVANMSTYHFSRIFKQTTGVSPHQYLLNHRIEQAKNLLCKTDFNIADISEKTGFSSLSYFSTVFRRLVKMSPKDYRGTR